MLGKDKIKDRATLVAAIRASQHWLEDHLQETVRRASRVAAKLS